MKNEQEILNDMESIESATVVEACRLIGEYNGSLKKYLVMFTAQLCDVEQEALLSESKNIDTVRARWLYWYAYRYMTGETHETIAKRNVTRKRFSSQSVGNAIFNMAQLIAEDGIWTKRWFVLKKIIKTILKNQSFEQDLFKPTVTVKFPKGVNVELIKQE